MSATIDLKVTLENTTKTPLTFEYKRSASELKLKYINKKYMKKLIKWIKALRLYFVSNSVCDLNPDFQQYLIEQGETKCKQCGKKLKAK